MVGFSLKKKDEGAKQGFSGFKLKKGSNNLPKKSNKPFGFAKEEDEEVKEQKIDTFDTNEGGAFNKEEGPITKEGPLVIENEGNHQWRNKAQQRFNPTAKPTTQESENSKLEYGINYLEKSADSKATEDSGNSSTPILSHEQESLSFKEDVKSRPEMATMEDYERIPVESFGAAMLRGMGWEGEKNEEKDEKKKAVIPVAQRTLYLGLGAKDNKSDGGLKPIDKTYVPVKMINRKTGEVHNEEEKRPNSRNRERSPIRSSSSNTYRSRN